MQLFKNVVVAATLLFTSTLFAQQAISLNLKKGETYVLHQKSVSKVAQVVNEVPQKSESIIEQVTEFLVTGMNGENYLIDLKPVKVSNTQSSAMGKMTMDSEGDETDPMNMIMKNLVNKVIKMELTPQGEIVNFNSNEYLMHMMDGVDLPEQVASQLKAQMADTYNDEALMESYKYYFGIYPKEKVKVGETWKSDYIVDVILPIETKTVNTLKSVDSNNMTIYSTADLTTNGEQTTTMMGVDAKANLEGSMTTTYVLDSKTGWISFMDQEQNIGGDITILKSDIIPEDMKMTMNIENTSTIGSK